MAYMIDVLAPLQLMECPGIPDCYGDLRQGECLMMGIRGKKDNEDLQDAQEDESSLLGCVVVSPLIQDPDTVEVSYFWMSEDCDKKDVFNKLFSNLKKLLMYEKKKRLLLWCYDSEKGQLTSLSPELLKGIGFVSLKHRLCCGAWAVGDVYDTNFLVREAVELELDPSLYSPHSFTRTKMKNICSRLNVLNEESFLPLTIENPLSRICMKDRRPKAGVFVSKPWEEILVIRGCCTFDKPDDEAFKTALGGALGAGLEGEGMNTLIIAMFRKKQHLENLESLLGPSDVSVKPQLFMYKL